MGLLLPPPAPESTPSFAAPTTLPLLAGRHRRQTVVEVVVVAFVVALPELVAGLGGLGRAAQIKTDVSYLDLVALFLSALGPGVLCVFLLWRDGILHNTMFRRRSAGFVVGWGALTVAALFGAAIVGGTLTSAIRSAVGSHAPSNVGTQDHLTVRYALVAIALSLAAGFAEESVFRAYGRARLEQLGYRRVAVWAPSVLWVALHLYGGPYTVLGVACLGVPLVWMAWWKNSIWPLMVAHAAWDLIAFLAATTQPHSVIVSTLIHR